jgi:hypothetical protein
LHRTNPFSNAASNEGSFRAIRCKTGSSLRFGGGLLLLLLLLPPLLAPLLPKV